MQPCDLQVQPHNPQVWPCYPQVQPCEVRPHEVQPRDPQVQPWIIRFLSCSHRRRLTVEGLRGGSIRIYDWAYELKIALGSLARNIFLPYEHIEHVFP